MRYLLSAWTEGKLPANVQHTQSENQNRDRGQFHSFPPRNGSIRFCSVVLKWHSTSTVHHGRSNLVTVAGLSVGVAGVVLELGS